MLSKNTLTDQHISDFLSYLEDEEAKLLSWGYVDGGFGETELFELASTWLGNLDGDFDPYALIDSLVEKQVLAEYKTTKGLLWRTRMSESVRLLARLRQVFSAQDWKISSNLVSDFRFITRKRRYPARNIDVPTALNEISKNSEDKKIQALEALLSRGEGFMLSRFQVDATLNMNHAINEQETRGMIVCAGTGTGKTLSFYLPALSSIASWIEKESFWTKAVAIYPRNELLKDQFIETYQEARRLDSLLITRNKRKVKIGAIYGDVPSNASSLEKSKWLKHGSEGYVCPYVKCPDEKCQSAMIWRYEDVENSRERLHCSECEKIIREDEIIITRDRMKIEPPDILFTSTEMMNRMMSDLSLRELIGIGSKQSPRLALLDEVHTYSGIHGAQVALLLRRWKYALSNPLHFTGLSATLEDAKNFFSQLTNIPPHLVDEINVGDDLEEEGKEYQIILRGDASSGTALLSTTIQTAMLMRRVLDINKIRPSGAMFGSKVFLFTDDLDITNRLYDDLRDAEGYSSWNRRIKDPLSANRREGSFSDPLEALQYGQHWKVAEEIGHDLRKPVDIGRTSSQDKGVSEAAELIVATASLEVGFNDPAVGAVIQHKAPIDLASFLQRKGRAGRKRGMRPWTVTVLSDFGRDRIMYQGYEMLFDPVLKSRSLPLHNRYVLRMQSVYAFMDWVAGELKRRKPSYTFGNLWSDFAIPKDKSARIRQLVVAEIIDDVLTKSPIRKKVELYLRDALSITEEELNVILWDPPRSLLISVLPTLYRRLDTNWRMMLGKDKFEQERYLNNHPLPEYIPANLFSDLTLPEIAMEREGEEKGEGPPHMPIVQALNGFAPGKVSRRFGTQKMKQSHWIAPPSIDSSTTPYVLDVKSFCTTYEEMGIVSFKNADGSLVEVPCLRPWNLKLSITPNHIGTTSNAFLTWHSQLIGGTNEDSNLTSIPLPNGTIWSEVIHDVLFYTHSQQTAVTVKRFTTGSNALIRHNQSQRSEVSMNFYRDDEQVALGFKLEADGIYFKLRLPQTEDLHLTVDYPEKLQSFRTLYFYHCLSKDIRLKGIMNSFQIEKLSETYLSALSATAVKNECSLEEAFNLLQRSSLRSACDKVLKIIYRSSLVDDSEDEHEDVSDSSGNQMSKKQEELLLLCELEEVQEVIYSHVPSLWKAIDSNGYEWARLRWATTVGTAFLQACKEISNQQIQNDLILDVSVDENDTHKAKIWITESTSGGGGVVEDIMEKYHADPRRFYRLVESALGPSDMELIDAELSRVLDLQSQDSKLREHFEKVRNLNEFGSSTSVLASLQSYLREKGILVTHTVMNSLYNRILKPGSNQLTDSFLERIVALWKSEELRLGIDMDVRVFAYVFSTNDAIVQKFKQALVHIDPSALEDATWRFYVIIGMLWPRGSQVRTRALSPNNPFAKYPPTDRELVLHGITDVETVYLSDDDWWNKVGNCLHYKGTVRIIAELSTGLDLQKALLRLASEPIEIGFLHVYPRVEGLSRDANNFIATLDIREV